MKVKKTGGNWNPKAWPVYFIASSVAPLGWGSKCHDYLLIAVNEMESAGVVTQVKNWIDRGKHVFIDSGVFNLSTRHAARHGLTMNQALSLAPADIDGFSELFDRYVVLMKTLGDRVWGYIEIDQGGRENKIKTREKLERLGLRPVPVYHPLNDGWDYFDYLAQRYDRICFGNVVLADSESRRRLIATAWERRRRYPHLWIHALGMTPSDITTAFPINSCDSSTWIGSARWGSHNALIANSHRSDLGYEFVYDRSKDAGDDRGYHKAGELCGYDAAIVTRTMRQIANDQRNEIGADPGLFNVWKRRSA